tara:strand:- start:2287 stop:3426 length:1140 start_codon:yes stop_codon:yes gene_type:complete
MVGVVSADTLFERFEFGDNEFVDVQRFQWIAQTFTIGSTGPNENFNLTKVGLKIYRQGIPGDGIVSIREVDWLGRPTGPDLASTIFDANSLIPDGAGVWTNISIGPVVLEQDKHYALVLGTSAGTGSQYIGWRERRGLTPLYLGGHEFISSDGGGSWPIEASDRSLMFRIYGISGPIPLEDGNFGNVNITEELRVGKDIYSIGGFFEFLGSLTSRIRNIFVEEVDAITINTEKLKVDNMSVCLEDGTNCPISEERNKFVFLSNFDDYEYSEMNYAPISGQSYFREVERPSQNIMPIDCVFRKLSAFVWENECNVESSIKLKSNFESTGIEITIPPGWMGRFSDVGEYVVKEGDLVNYEFTTGNNCNLRLMSISSMCNQL